MELPLFLDVAAQSPVGLTFQARGDGLLAESSVRIDVFQPMLGTARDNGLLRDNVDDAMMMDWILRSLVSLLSFHSYHTRDKLTQRTFLEKMLVPALLK